MHPFAKLKTLLRGIPEKNLLLILSLFVGICSGLAAVILTTLVEHIKDFLTSRIVTAGETVLYLVLPGVGMLISMLLLRYVIKDKIGHGVTKVRIEEVPGPLDLRYLDLIYPHIPYLDLDYLQPEIPYRFQ